MLQALRIAIEDSPPLFSHPVSKNCHPLYTDIAGNSTPCLPEFIRFMECVNDEKNADCQSYFDKLLKCLKKHRDFGVGLATVIKYANNP